MYFYADDIDKLDENFEKLKNSKIVSVLEIKTPRTLNAQILADYFKALNKKDNE
jgi:2-succinyl-5-enolpyruvyl-6-hydroxy-3-cyclohexene-1-carboxylate synthase